MKILLDECVTRKAKRLLAEFDVFTVAEMEFSGLKNGKLLSKAEECGFDILLTIDKNIDYQQNISNYQLAIVILDVAKSSIKYVEELMPKFRSQITTFEKGHSYRIEKE